MQALSPQQGTKRPGRSIDGVAAQLAEYYAASSPGAASNFGIMCDRLSMHAHASAPCPACSGLGIRELTSEQIARWKVRIAAESRVAIHQSLSGDEHAYDGVEQLRDRLGAEGWCSVCAGTGFVEPRMRRGGSDPFFVTKKCYRCRGTGEIYDEDNEDRCPRCEGSAFTVPVTVNETGCSKKGKAPRREAGADPYSPSADGVGPSASDEVAVVEHGRMANLVSRIKHADEVAAVALEAYYGADGDRWGKTAWGRAFVLWQFTKPGQILIELGAKASERSHGFLVKHMDLLASEREAEARREVPNMQRRALLMQADKASRHLLERSQRALAEAMAT